MSQSETPIFDINSYPFDEEHNCLEIGGEAMIFHCHHYMMNLQRTILDAEYIQSELFLIGSAADSLCYQLSNLCQGLSVEASKEMAQAIYKSFGNGVIDLSTLGEAGGVVVSKSSFVSTAWRIKYGKSEKPMDFFTTGFVAAALSVIYGVSLGEIFAKQLTCMAMGDAYNSYEVRVGECNFSTYPKKAPTVFKEVPKVSLNWEHEEKITKAFLGAHATFVGNDEGLIPAFGVYLLRTQSDYVNRLQIEFANAIIAVAGEYGETLAGELLMEAGHACGFFTYGGIMSSKEWEMAVKPYLETKEDWIKGLAALVNTMGWGYHTAVELGEQKAVFRNYNDFEDLSYLRMYGTNSYPIHWANSGGFTGLMQMVYNTDIVNGVQIETEEGFREMRRSKVGYKTKMTKGISCGDDFLEVEVYL